MEDRGSIQEKGWIILLFWLSLNATESPIQWALLAGINLPEREVHHISFPSADVSKTWDYSSACFSNIYIVSIYKRHPISFHYITCLIKSKYRP
jgi:hypothetical protein